MSSSCESPVKGKLTETSLHILSDTLRPPRVWARATKGRPSEHVLTSSALRTRARGPLAAHPGPASPRSLARSGPLIRTRARHGVDATVRAPARGSRATQSELRTEFAQHAFRTTHVREGPIRRRLR